MKQNANTPATTSTITPPTTPPATAPADMVDRFCDEASIAEPGSEDAEVCALELEGVGDETVEPEVGPLEVTPFAEAEIVVVVEDENVGGVMGGGIGADEECVGALAVTVMVGSLTSSSKVYTI